MRRRKIARRQRRYSRFARTVANTSMDSRPSLHMGSRLGLQACNLLLYNRFLYDNRSLYSRPLQVRPRWYGRNARRRDDRPLRNRGNSDRAQIDDLNTFVGGPVLRPIFDRTPKSKRDQAIMANAVHQRQSIGDRFRAELRQIEIVFVRSHRIGMNPDQDARRRNLRVAQSLTQCAEQRP
jgi:hypothetical protein